MARIEIKVSDLSGEPIRDEGQAARLIVEHPGFPEPIGLDISAQEVAPHLSEQATRFVVLSLEEPDNPNPQRYVMAEEEFDRLFEAGDSTSVLDQALTNQQEEAERTRGRRGRRQGGRRQTASRRRERIDYTSPEHAGEPHRGTISEAERLYVQEHLDEVNERLRQKGMREIDPSDLTMIERYGLQPPEL